MVVLKYIIGVLLLAFFVYVIVHNIIGIVNKIKEKRLEKKIDVVISGDVATEKKDVDIEKK